MAIEINLRYGRGEIPLRIADDVDVTVIRKPPMPILEHPRDAVAGALRNGVDVAPLSEMAASASTACIAICDITRPVPNGLFLRPIIETLIAAGVPATGITVLVATGLHRPNEGDELAELIGDRWVLQNVTVANHFARSDADHVELGRTSTRGTVVRLDRRFVEADIRIATGLVEPHFMAGYSGGRKVIAPGLAHAETITTFHSARFMADPAATNCNFIGNPLHEEQLQIVEMLGGALSLNTVIDEDRNLSFVNFGEIVHSHELAVQFVREYCEVAVPRRFHTVVTSAAGHPLDQTYYQTVKAMVGPVNILSPGGDLIVASQCNEGIGSPEFIDAQQRLNTDGPDAFVQSILQKSHADVDEWQTQMQLKPMAAGNIQLFADGLSAQQRPITGVNVIDDLDAAIAQSVARSGEKAIAVIPEGPYVVPMLKP
ncbi:MAG: nickel-dependent lactate racemase [Pirellulaceae bacterium]|nr:nickel-dependent lactate racemase [Pirellulaceae bacterium]